MSIKEWSTTYTGANPVQDADPVTGSQPDLDDETAVGAGDGDEARSSQVETPRDKLQAVCKMVGDSANAPAGSLAEILDRDHANGDARQVRLRERAAAPATVAGKSFLYSLTSDGKAYVKRGDGTTGELGVDTGGQTNTVTGANGITNTGDNVDAVLAPTYGSAANTVCQGNDARLSDERDPTNHASDHENGGGDEISVAGLSGALADDQNADAIRTTTGPTLLAVGAWADGEYLKRSGSTAVGDTPGGGGFTAYEEEFTASAGSNEFTLSATPAVNANTLSGRNILGVFCNGVRLRYRATVTLSNEYNQSGGTNKINVVGQAGGEIFTVVFGV